MIYLDWAATAVPNVNAQIQSLRSSMEVFANPSSTHRFGNQAKTLLESARSSLITTVLQNIPTAISKPLKIEIAFTGSGTEADQIPLLSLLSRQARGTIPHIVISSIEHAAIYAQTKVLERLGVEVSMVDPEEDGIVDPDRILSALRPSTRLVCLMAVNNETGAIQRIEETASKLASWSLSGNYRQPLFHVDCIQAFGKLPLTLPVSGLTSVAFSAHKLGGPKGIGALAYYSPMEALAQGGGQEKGMRAGTENLFGALAFADAAREASISRDSNFSNAVSLMKHLLEGVSTISGALPIPCDRKAVDSRFSPWITSLSFPGLSGEVLARALSDAGIAVSTGSACSQASPAKSKTKGRRILEAMRINNDIAFGTIRVSVGHSTTAAEIDLFLDKVSGLYRSLKT